MIPLLMLALQLAAPTALNLTSIPWCDICTPHDCGPLPAAIVIAADGEIVQVGCIASGELVK